MAYTAVKLADVQKAIDAVKSAQSKYETAVKNTSKTSNAQKAIDTALKNLNDAQKKLDTLQSDFDNEKFKQTASVKTAQTNLDKSQSFLDNEGWMKTSNIVNFQKAVDNAKTDKARETAEKNLNTAIDNARKTAEKDLAAKQKSYDTAYNSARTTAQKAIDAQANLINGEKNKSSLQIAYDKAQSAYQKIYDEIEPTLNAKNDAISRVSEYVNNIKDSLGDVTKKYDLEQVKTLLKDIKTSVGNTKIDDLVKPINSMISQIDPVKMSAIPYVNIQNANPDYFPNIDRETGLPMLDQGALDSVLDKYKSNYINKDQYRDNYNRFGWNVKSDASSAMRGPAIVGIDKGMIGAGMGQGTPGFVKPGTNQAVTDADFKKAAEQLGIDVTPFYSGKKLDQNSLYDAIYDHTKDFYLVANALDRTGAAANKASPHAAILFKADGSGNLIPVLDQKGKPAAQYFSGVGVTHEGWRGTFSDLAPLIMVASAVFLPGVGNALTNAISQSTLGTAIGATGSAALSGAIINGGMAAITGGDIGKAMLTGAVGGAASANAGDIAKTVMGGGNLGAENIAKIAEVAKLSTNQVEKIIASGVTTGLASAVVDPNRVLENTLTSIVGNFASEEAKNLVSGSIDPKSLDGAATLASNAANVAATAAVRGDDIVDALQNSAASLAKSAAIAQYKYQPPTGTGASGFPIQKEVETYYEDLIASGFNDDVIAQIKEIFPNLSDKDANAMANAFTKNVASEQVGQAIADLRGMDVGSMDKPIGERYVGLKENLGVMHPASESNNPVEAQLYERTLPDGSKVYYYEAYDKNTGKTQLYINQGGTGSAGEEFSFFTPTTSIPTEPLPKDQIGAPTSQPLSGEMTGGAFETQYLDELKSKIANTDAAVKAATQGIAPSASSNLADSFVRQFVQNPDVMAYYINEANRVLGSAGMKSPSQTDLNKTAISLLEMDVASMFPTSGGTTSGTTGSATSGTTGGTTGGTTEGTAGGTSGGTTGGTAGGIEGGAGEGTGAGGTGGEDLAAKAAAEKAALQKRQEAYKGLMGIAGLPARPSTAGTTSPSAAFYYGKEFGSPMQQIGAQGELIQQPYRELSVTQPGKEAPWRPQTEADQQVAPGEGTDENDVSSLIKAILGQGDEASLNDILGILGRGSYG